MNPILKKPFPFNFLYFVIANIFPHNISNRGRDQAKMELNFYPNFMVKEKKEKKTVSLVMSKLRAMMTTKQES